jgi:predicted aspartyl protease
MVSKRMVSLCAVALLICGTSVVAEQIDDASAKRVNFRLYEHYLIVVQGSLGGLANKNLLIDTGTNPTIIDERVAEQLQLESLTNMPDTIPVVTGFVKTRFSLLPKLEFGPLRRQSVMVAVENLSSLRKHVGTRIDAVVGLDVLGKTSFRIDYGKKVIVFGPLDDQKSKVSFSSGPPLVTVPMTINHHPMTLLIDTGTSGLILFGNRLGTLQRGLPQLGAATTIGLGGPMFVSALEVDHAQMGDHELGVRRAYLSTRNACCAFDGLMGISPALMKQVGFDFEHQLFSWQLRDEAIPTMSEACPDSCLPALAPGPYPGAGRVQMRLSQ